MNKNDVISKMEEYVQSYREQLEKHDGSSVSALVSNAKQAFENVKEHVMQNDKAKARLDTLKDHLEKLENAAVSGEKTLSAKAVSLMEEGLEKLKRKLEEKEESSPAENKTADAAKETPKDDAKA